jgi:hypothetical protein
MDMTERVPDRRLSCQRSPSSSHVRAQAPLRQRNLGNRMVKERSPVRYRVAASAGGAVGGISARRRGTRRPPRRILRKGWSRTARSSRGAPWALPARGALHDGDARLPVDRDGGGVGVRGVRRQWFVRAHLAALPRRCSRLDLPARLALLLEDLPGIHAADRRAGRSERPLDGVWPGLFPYPRARSESGCLRRSRAGDDARMGRRGPQSRHPRRDERTGRGRVSGRRRARCRDRSHPRGGPFGLRARSCRRDRRGALRACRRGGDGAPHRP